MMHIPRGRHHTRHTTLRRTRHNLSPRHRRRIQIQRIKRILLSRPSKRRSLKPRPPVLSPRFRTFKRGRRILWTRVLFLFILVVVWDGAVLRWQVWKMTFWTGVFRGGELVG